MSDKWKMKLKIITYNVNGLRAAIGKGLPEWIAQTQPDVLCIQETKLQPDQFPAMIFTELGYNTYLHSAQKRGYSGVAILAKKKPDHVAAGMGIAKYDSEGRFLRADYGDVSIVSVYHPSGTTGSERQNFKMIWLEDFRMYVAELRKTHPNLVLCGDFNIAHKDIDIHDPKGNAQNSGFLPEERQWMTSFLSGGFIDSYRYLNPNKQQYTWWSFRFNARVNNKGWRIDYCMVSAALQSHIRSAYILNEVVHSDHCPAVLEIET
jgi:exodeoxyribonuclease-3